MKILLAKPGLDGHDVGVKVLAHGLIDAGYEVVYTGLRKSIEEIVDIATASKADMIGLSILSGTHLILAKKMREVMDQRKLSIPWFVGGNIPAKDILALTELGAAKAFPTGSKITDVTNYFNSIMKAAQTTH